MKYTSLSHWNTGHNVQQNWNSVEEWHDYCEEDSSVVWSKLFTSVDGEFVGEYPERLELSAVAVPDEINWRHPKLQGLLSQKARLEYQMSLFERMLEEDWDGEYFYPDQEYTTTTHDRLYKLLQAKSPRITEQDAREMADWITENHTDYDTSGSRTHHGRIFCLDCGAYENDGKIAHTEKCIVIKCSALLDKLNGESK